MDRGLFSLIWLILLFVIFYLLIIRPQQVRLRQRQELIASLRVGDRVETTGGIQGIVTEIQEDIIKLEIAPQVVINVSRRAVAQRIE